MKNIFIYCLFFLGICCSQHNHIHAQYSGYDNIDALFQDSGDWNNIDPMYGEQTLKQLGENNGWNGVSEDNKGRNFYNKSSYYNKTNNTYRGDGASTGQDDCRGIWVTRNDGSGYCCGNCR